MTHGGALPEQFYASGRAKLLIPIGIVVLANPLNLHGSE
jgi:hypothetical protein